MLSWAYMTIYMLAGGLTSPCIVLWWTHPNFFFLRVDWRCSADLPNEFVIRSSPDLIVGSRKGRLIRHPTL